MRYLFVSASFAMTFGAFLAFVGCSKSDTTVSKLASVEDAPKLRQPIVTIPSKLASSDITSVAEESHGHRPGTHGGIIASLGRESYHVEAIVTTDGELRLYMLGADESRVIDVENQELTAYVKPQGSSEAKSIVVKPSPQPGDEAGRSSLFVGQLEAAHVGKALDVTIPIIKISGERFRLGFSTKSEHAEEAMPEKVVDSAERELYLTPGGLYSQDDIEANGNVTASQKFDGFVAAHDLNPQPGDKLCPVTLTKANSQCSWIIGGNTYEFCCPPCVDEFVTLAKTNPEAVKNPDRYVKLESPADGAKR